MADLKKAYIEPLAGRSTDPIEVLFNPAEYSIETGNTFQSNAAPGLPCPLVQFVNGNSDTLTLELFFDTYTDGGGGDVREHTRKVTRLLDMDPSLHAPPPVRFCWGDSLRFQAVVERVTQKYTMFRADGTPVRATLSVTFREYKTLEEQLRDPPLESADLTKRHVVTGAETLWSIAYAEYGSVEDWRLVAGANEDVVDNPRRLRPRCELRLPPKPAPGRTK